MTNEIYDLDGKFEIERSYSCVKETTYLIYKKIPEDSPKEYKKPIYCFVVPNHFLLEAVKDRARKVINDNIVY